MKKSISTAVCRHQILVAVSSEQLLWAACVTQGFIKSVGGVKVQSRAQAELRGGEEPDGTHHVSAKRRAGAGTVNMLSRLQI